MSKLAQTGHWAVTTMQQTRQWSLVPDTYLNVPFLSAATGGWTLECPRPTADLAPIARGVKVFSQ